MYYDNFPIFKSALDLVVYVETIVKGFDKYHKYTLGEDLRQQSKEKLMSSYTEIVEYLDRELELTLRDSYNLNQTIGVINETDPFNYDSA